MSLANPYGAQAPGRAIATRATPFELVHVAADGTVGTTYERSIVSGDYDNGIERVRIGPPVMDLDSGRGVFPMRDCSNFVVKPIIKGAEGDTAANLVLGWSPKLPKSKARTLEPGAAAERYGQIPWYAEVLLHLSLTAGAMPASIAGATDDHDLTGWLFCKTLTVTKDNTWGSSAKPLGTGFNDAASVMADACGHLIIEVVATRNIITPSGGSSGAPSGGGSAGNPNPEAVAAFLRRL